MDGRWFDTSATEGAVLRLSGGGPRAADRVALPGRRTPLDAWLQPRLNEAGLMLLSIVILVGMTAVVVHSTGGTRNSPAHLAYIPIILAGLSFGVPGGVIAAMAAGLALGPPMPLDVATGEMQPAANWLARLGFFLLAGMVTGSGARVLKKVTADLRASGYFDRETGLPNLASFQAVAPRLVREEPVTGLYVLRVNNLANVTTAFGFAFAATFVRELSARLESIMENSQFLAPPFRVDDSDFVLLSTEPPSHRLSDWLLERLREPVVLQGVPVAPDPSLGFADLCTTDAHPEALLRQAAAAAEEHRRTGSYAGAGDAGIEARRRARVAMLGALHQALDTPQIHLVYQPKIRLDGSRALAGCEALVRWQHPEHGLVPPGVFVPLAEETGLMWPMTQAVLRKALSQMAAWRRQGRGCIVAINFSARDFLMPDMVRRVEAALAEYDVPREWIEIEVTESAINSAPETMLANMRRLRDAGLRLSIDDYGVGASSLSYLKNIPASVLKIDQSFIRNIARDDRDAAIVASTVELAHNLDLRVVAEGVEDEETARILAELGCDVAQGYFFDRPLPPERFAARYLVADTPQNSA